MYAQWAREKVGPEMAGTPGDEKAGGYTEAFRGLAWLEEYLQQSLGWGDMRKLHVFITQELVELAKKNARDLVKGVGKGSRGCSS